MARDGRLGLGLGFFPTLLSFLLSLRMQVLSKQINIEE
jgi:hypothetical protein